MNTEVESGMRDIAYKPAPVVKPVK